MKWRNIIAFMRRRKPRRTAPPGFTWTETAPEESDAVKSIHILQATGCMILHAPVWFNQLSEQQMIEYADKYWYEGRA